MLVPQSDLEDLLKVALENQALSGLPLPSARLQRAVRRLVRDGLARGVSRSGNLDLTESGQREAAHIERSHQLWESHLMTRGMAAADAHTAAERLEHLHDRRVLDRFDNELDHPDADVHGMPIPGEKEANPEKAPLVRLSLMREGDCGCVAAGKGPDVAGLAPGARFCMRGRDPLSGDWIVQPDGGDCLRVTHTEADDVSVEV